MAFAVGAGAGCLVGLFPSSGSVLVSMALVLLCPALPLAFMLLGSLEVGLFTPGFMLALIPVCAVLNGAIYGLLWHLARSAIEGKRVLFLPAALGAGLWLAWFITYSLENWPKPEPPLAPVAVTSPLAGRWVGTIHGTRGDVPVTLVLLPRTDGALDGFQCTSPEYVERFDKGRHAGDSLRYDILSFQQRGRRDGATMTIESSVGRTTQVWELRFASADTGRAGLPVRVEGP